MIATLPIAMIAVFFLVSSSNSNACTCISLSLDAAYRNSSAIFIGFVTSSEIIDNQGSSEGIAQIKVESVLLGDLNPHVEARTYEDLCSNTHFRKGERYLIYVYRGNVFHGGGKKGKIKKFASVMCSRVLRLDEAEKDLQFLRAQQDSSPR